MSRSSRRPPEIIADWRGRSTPGTGSRDRKSRTCCRNIRREPNARVAAVMPARRAAGQRAVVKSSTCGASVPRLGQSDRGRDHAVGPHAGIDRMQLAEAANSRPAVMSSTSENANSAPTRTLRTRRRPDRRCRPGWRPNACDGAPLRRECGREAEEQHTADRDGRREEQYPAIHTDVRRRAVSAEARGAAATSA